MDRARYNSAMTRSPDRTSVGLFYLAVALLLGATVLRALVRLQHDPNLASVLGLFFVWFLLFAAESLAAGRWTSVVVLYLGLQATLTFGLFQYAAGEDFFAALFAVLSMQAWLRLTPRWGALWLGAFACLMAIPMTAAFGWAQGLAFTTVYTAGNALLASYAWTLRRARQVRAQTAALTDSLSASNDELRVRALEAEHLAAQRERQRLARDLHDSVTQMLFSMTLSAQSAELLLPQHRDRVRDELGRISDLAARARRELTDLIAALGSAPSAAVQDGSALVAAIRADARDPRLDGLVLTFDTDGDGSLSARESQTIFRFVQEALNNVVKHSGAREAQVQLRLNAQPFVEVSDGGRGFDATRAPAEGTHGLAGMRERAAEIGWVFWLSTTPGGGTRVRLFKPANGGQTP